MKSLLHSEIFRKNLYRWLGMYLIVMLLFTFVITYSKYMVGFVSSDEARVANFNIDIQYDQANGCRASDEDVCFVGRYRPTSNFSYYFTVDTRNIEVKTFLALAVNVHSKFEIVEFASLGDDGVYHAIDLTDKKEDNKIKMTEVLSPNAGELTRYRLTVLYNSKFLKTDEDGSLYYDDNIENIDKIVTVDYSAEQLSSE